MKTDTKAFMKSIDRVVIFAQGESSFRYRIGRECQLAYISAS